MRLVLLAMSVALFLPACADNGSTGDDQPVNCALEDRDDDFVVGLSKVGDGAALGFSLMTADPAPPARGDNTWVVQINQMTNGVAGAAVTDATLTVTPFMPDHGHPAGKTVKIEPTGVDGQYQLSPINLWMPGLWEITIDTSSASGDDSVVFRFCIPS